jgi:hypothetical protein
MPLERQDELQLHTQSHGDDRLARGQMPDAIFQQPPSVFEVLPASDVSFGRLH